MAMSGMLQADLEAPMAVDSAQTFSDADLDQTWSDLFQDRDHIRKTRIVTKRARPNQEEHVQDAKIIKQIYIYIYIYILIKK